MKYRTEPAKPALPPPADVPLDVAEQVSGGMRPIEFGGAIAAFVLSHMFL